MLLAVKTEVELINQLNILNSFLTLDGIAEAIEKASNGIEDWADNFSRQQKIKDSAVKEADFIKGLNKIQENFFALEEQMITIQKNQVEFEKYLKQILEKVEKIEKR
jgi:hypothetical protein